MPRMPTQDEETIMAILRAADRLRRRYARLLAPHAITLQQYNVLRILRGAGADGLSTLTIVERMIERAPGITRLLGRLVRKGLVVRRRDVVDQRIVTCKITSRGRQLLERLDDAVARADAAAVSGFPSGERSRLVALLAALGDDST